MTRTSDKALRASIEAGLEVGVQRVIPIIVTAGFALAAASAAADLGGVAPPLPSVDNAPTDSGLASDPDAVTTALDRLQATTEAAMTNWKEGRARLHDAAAKQAEARAEGAPASPFVMLSTEGWDSSFDRAPNAQDTLQALFPFNLPGQTKAVRSYTEAATGNFDADRYATYINVASEAGQRWLERAAALERAEVRRVRLARIDEALSLQEAKFQLGEVAGTEVMQLDLEHVRETSQLAADEAASESAREALIELCLHECEMPMVGDLEVLVGETRTPEENALTLEAVEAGGMLRQSRAVSASTVARSELISRTAYGRPAVGVEWERFPTLYGAPSYDAWGGFLSLPLPIGRAGKQTKLAAQEQAAASKERVEGIRRELFRRAASARVRAEAASRRLSTLATVLPDLPSIEYSLSQQFRLGAISYLAYLDGLKRLDEVQMEAVAARKDLLLARLELGSILADPTVFPLPTIEGDEQ